MIAIPKTKSVYKNKGKMYMFKSIGQAITDDGFIADGTMNPIHFHLYKKTIFRRSLENIGVVDHRSHAHDPNEWQIYELVKMIFERQRLRRV